MKTKTVWTKTLALLMTVAMLMSSMVLALPVNAVDANKKTYNAKGVDPALMVVDGGVSANEPWEDAEWKYLKTDYNRGAANAGDRFKVLWGGEHVYLMIEFVDKNNVYNANTAESWNSDAFLLYIDESGSASYSAQDDNDGLDYTWRTGTLLTEDVGSNKTANTVEYRVDRRNLDGTDNADGSGQLIRVEAKMPFKKTNYASVGNTIGLDMRIQTYDGTNRTTYNVGTTNQPQTYIPCVLGEIEYAKNKISRIEDLTLISLDGNANEEIWNKVDAYTGFTKVQATASFNIAPTLKTLWGTDETGTAYVYLLIQHNDPDGTFTQGWDKDACYLGVDETANATSIANALTASNATHDCNWFDTSAGTNKVNSNWINVSVGRTGSGSECIVTIEAKIKLLTVTDTPDEEEVISLTVLPQPHNGSGFARYTMHGNQLREHVGLYTKFALSDNVIEINREVTLMNGMNRTEIRKENVKLGSEYTLPTVDLENGLPFLGWIVGDQFLPAGAKITISDNITISAYSIGLEMEDGAAVRLTATTGMRWITYLDDANLPLSAKILAKGTLIVPADYLTGDVAFTHAGLEAAGRQANQAQGYLDLVAEEFVPDEYKYANAGNRNQFNGSIVEIKDTNYERDFAAVGYVKVRYSNGTEAYIYADYSECVRNVKYVAERALADTTVTFNAAETAVLKTFAGLQ